jgi:outer membrane receptor protein involved in Fe transport
MVIRGNIEFKLSCAAMIASISFMALPVSAQENTETIGDIIVTANKRAQSINDVGLTITALGSDTLQRQGIRSLDDLARSVPGLTYSGTDVGTPVFTLRGVGFYDYSLGGYPTTSIYVDEVPLPFPVMTLHANIDLERIEVLKGPQGTLFGQNSTGGAINYIAAKPTQTLAAGMDATIGRFGQGEANGYISGPLSDTVGVRLAGQYGYGGPWQKSFTRDAELGRRNYINGRLLVDWEPSSAVKVRLNLNGWRDTSEPQAGQYFVTFPQILVGGVPVPGQNDPVLENYPFAPEDPRAADWGPRLKQNRRQLQAALRTDLNLTDDIVLTSISSYINYKFMQVSDRDTTTVRESDQASHGHNRVFTQELRLAGGENSPLRWVVGANYERTRIFELTSTDNSEGAVGRLFGINGGPHEGSHKIRSYAAFANAEYDIAPKLTLKLGGRYTDVKRTANLCTVADDAATIAFVGGIAQALNPNIVVPPLNIGDCVSLDIVTNLPGDFIDTLKEDNVSWRAGLDYKPSRDLLLYANVSKGYKAGSYPLVGTLSQNSYLPVVQESLLDYEAGFKAQLADRRVSLNGAVFWYDYRNKQLLTRIIDPFAGLIPALANIPKSRVRGAELELTAVPVEGLQISGGLTYLDAKITNYTGINAGGVPADFAGTDIPFTSKWQYVASVDYTVPMEGSFRPFLGATLSGRSSATSIVGSAVGAVQRAGFRSLVPIDQVYDMPGYALLDLRVGIEAADADWRLTFWGRNVTNKYYIQNIVTSFESIGRYAGQPATYGVTFMHKFR